MVLRADPNYFGTRTPPERMQNRGNPVVQFFRWLFSPQGKMQKKGLTLFVSFILYFYIFGELFFLLVSL